MSSTKDSTKDKFRISLSSADLDYIVSLVSSEYNGDVHHKVLLDYLKLQQFKASTGMKATAFTVTGERSMNVEEKLGFNIAEMNREIVTSANGKKINRLELYNRWMIDPGSVTADELDYVMSYGAEKGLIAGEVLDKYFNSLFSTGDPNLKSSRK